MWRKNYADYADYKTEINRVIRDKQDNKNHL